MKRKIISIFMVILILSMMTTSIFAGNLSISSPSGMLLDSKTGEVMYEKNIDTQRAIASTTKIMTYLLTMEAIDQGKISMTDIVTVSSAASKIEGSNYKLKKGDKLSVRELIDSMIIISANDSAVVLAEHVSGSVREFSKLMNAKAKELGLHKARFINPNGLPLSNNDQNKATTRDLAKITSYTLGKYEEDLINASNTEYFIGKYKNFNQRNTNKLLRMTEIVDGLKTGYTKLAGHCLVSTYVHPESRDHRIISIVLGSKNSDQRFDDSLKLIEYGIQNYGSVRIVSAGDVLFKDTIHLGEKYVPIEYVVSKDLNKFTLKTIKLDKLTQNPVASEISSEEILRGEELKAKVKLTDGSEEEVSLIARRGISVFLNDYQVEFNGIEPVIKEDRTLIPVRALTEKMGFEVVWNGEDNSIRLTKEGHLIEFKIGSSVVRRDGQDVILDASAELINNTTFIPLRFVSESLNKSVSWIGDSREIMIRSM